MLGNIFSKRKTAPYDIAAAVYMQAVSNVYQEDNFEDVVEMARISAEGSKDAAVKWFKKAEPHFIPAALAVNLLPLRNLGTANQLNKVKKEVSAQFHEITEQEGVKPMYYMFDNYWDMCLHSIENIEKEKIETTALASYALIKKSDEDCLVGMDMGDTYVANPILEDCVKFKITAPLAFWKNFFEKYKLPN